MSIFRAPRAADLPHWSYLIDDCHATPTQLAHYLDISPATLARYTRSGSAPRAVHLALFWESRWGLQAGDVDLFNTAQVHRQHAQSLQEHIGRMAGIIWRLEVELARSPALQAANLPVWRVA